jgi:hypothetical protein
MPLVNVMVNSKAYTRSIGPEKCAAVFRQAVRPKKTEATQCP